VHLGTGRTSLKVTDPKEKGKENNREGRPPPFLCRYSGEGKKLSFIGEVNSFWVSIFLSNMGKERFHLLGGFLGGGVPFAFVLGRLRKKGNLFPGGGSIRIFNKKGYPSHLGGRRVGGRVGLHGPVNLFLEEEIRLGN